MKVALVYDRLNKWGGAERVLLAFHKLFPQATWYTSLWNPHSANFSANWDVCASIINKLPFIRNHHDKIPFLMPFIFESYDFSFYDLVISISSEAAKAVITKPGTVHLNYCLTPTRYLYSHQNIYLTNPLFRYIAQPLRQWDLVAATRPDEMISISTCVKKRIKKYYNRDSTIIFPPVDVSKFTAAVTPHRHTFDYYLLVSRLVSYKNIASVIRVFANMPDQNLVIIGTGSQEASLRRLATPNIYFIKSVIDKELVSYYSQAKALIHPAVEDFGLVMAEAQAAGTPVIAQNKGGALDIVQDGVTGLLYDGSKEGSLDSAIKLFAKESYSRQACRQNAKRFDIHIWEQQIIERIKQYVQS